LGGLRRPPKAGILPPNPRRRVLETRILTPRRHRGASSCPQRFAKLDAGTPLLTSFNLLHPITGSENALAPAAVAFEQIEAPRTLERIGPGQPRAGPRSAARSWSSGLAAAMRSSTSLARFIARRRLVKGSGPASTMWPLPRPLLHRSKYSRAAGLPARQEDQGAQTQQEILRFQQDGCGAILPCASSASPRCDRPRSRHAQSPGVKKIR